MTFALAILLAAQIGGKPVNGGNPTPGTPQPDPPNVAERITATGCVQLVKDAPKVADGNTVMDTRYVLTNADSAAKIEYKLSAIESQLSPFAGAKVEISGEPKTPGSNILQVEFVQKLAARCR
ncbi:MAG TPA: hypothetical protein VFP91_03705 [Vicinamibacterales bacterium]|nr:hypothetical protein [Vicinamibacterales bacterium]